MRKSWRYFTLLFAAMVILLASSTPAQTVLFSDFGPDQSFNMSSWQSVFKTSVPGDFSLVAQGVGSAFTITASLTGAYYLNHIDVAVSGTPGDSAFMVQVTEDAAGIPGTVLETWLVSSASLPLTTVVDTINLKLNTGQQYWVVVQPFAAYSNENDVWYEAFSNPFPSALNQFYGKPNGVVENFGWTSASGSLAFDVVGTAVSSLPRPHLVGGAIGQIIRVVAGPVMVPPGVPVELDLGFLDIDGNAIGPNSTVTLSAGQTATLDLEVGAFVQRPGQRILVRPVVSVANPTAVQGSVAFAPSAVSLQEVTQVFDKVTSFETVLVPDTPGFSRDPIFEFQGLAGGQTIQLIVSAAFPQTPCNVNLGFDNESGNPVAPGKQVNLEPGQSASLELRAESLGLQGGQQMELQPFVIPAPSITAGPPIRSACQASAEVFDTLTGRTMTYQVGGRQ
jgi:hypothetical protein